MPGVNTALHTKKATCQCNKEVHMHNRYYIQTAEAMSAVSAVWDFFTVSEKDRRLAICKTCSTDISRGGNTTNTTNLKAHLKSRHIDEYNDFLKADKKRQDALAAKKMQSTNKVKTQSIETAFEKRNKFPTDSAKAKNLDKKWSSSH